MKIGSLRDRHSTPLPVSGMVVDIRAERPKRVDTGRGKGCIRCGNWRGASCGIDSLCSQFRI